VMVKLGINAYLQGRRMDPEVSSSAPGWLGLRRETLLQVWPHGRWVVEVVLAALKSLRSTEDIDGLHAC
jgi:hypothetical protein